MDSNQFAEELVGLLLGVGVYINELQRRSMRIVSFLPNKKCEQCEQRDSIFLNVYIVCVKIYSIYKTTVTLFTIDLSTAYPPLIHPMEGVGWKVEGGRCKV